MKTVIMITGLDAVGNPVTELFPSSSLASQRDAIKDAVDEFLIGTGMFCIISIIITTTKD